MYHTPIMKFLSKSFRSVFAVLCVGVLFFSLLVGCSNKRSGPPKVLVFSKTTGFVHSSIDAGNQALLQLGQDHGFVVDTTTNAIYFNEDSLAQYAAVVFLNTSGDVLDHIQEAAFERYIQSGGGFVGIHGASTTEYHWGWFGRLVGAYFDDHPKPQPAEFRVIDQSHASTEHMPETFTYDDEWYNFYNINPDIQVLVSIDPNSYEGSKHEGEHPMAWYHDFDGGRSFFTGFGHSDKSFSDPLILQHILGGIQYAMGDNSKLDYRKARTLPVPERERFVRTTLLTGGLFEPTELAILPNFDLLVAQRRGELMLFKQETGEVEQVGLLDVYHQSGVPNVNAEEGFMGLALDPDYENNQFLYAFYSPIDTSVNRLSRFRFVDGKLDMESEKTVLEFYSQRQICCHTGGSIAFGPDGLLYLATGDNSTPFNQPTTYQNKGFAPIDSRPGFEQYDARRSSANTNDLRGSVLRIRVLADGTYEIPEGNLFPQGQEGTRPEIYTMGTRNAYRITVDQKNSFLYWGDVGPDAADDEMDTRGPRGYDEINQARSPGFYGWPLFIGDNYAYRAYDYNTGESGEPFDPNRPINDSPNNTGLRELPPAQPAFIWYPYAHSDEFPQLGSGGRNAMPGPVYYTDLYDKKTRYPEYFHGKLFIYDWIRGWIKVVTMRENGDYDKMEPFLSDVSLANPIDMEVGKDGRLYILEYGRGWFAKNEDAGISRIDFYGDNFPPQVGDITVEQANGELPFTVRATVDAVDPEGKTMTYTWRIGDAVHQTKEPRLEYEITTRGEYEIGVQVADDSGAKIDAEKITIYAGNTTPTVDIKIAEGAGYFSPGDRIAYEVLVDDQGREIDPSSLVVTVNYIKVSDMAGSTQGHQQVSAAVMGRSLILASDCQSCHTENSPSVGPTYVQVAQRYKNQKDASSYLSDKIINGGSGAWGTVAMAAHPDIKPAEAQQMVEWIMSLGDDKKRSSLPGKGEVVVTPPTDIEKDEDVIIRITAQYTNSPGLGITPLTGTKIVDLKLKRN